MTMSGADSDELDRVGVRLDSAAHGLKTKGERIRSDLYAAPWRGPSADQFRQEFDSRHLQAIMAAARFLDEAQQTLHRNAQEQRHASGVAQHQLPPDLAALLEQMPNLARALQGVKLLFDDWPGLGEIELGGLSLAMAVIALGLPEGSNWRLVAEGLDHIADVAGSILAVVHSLSGTVGKAFPVFGLLGGSLGFVADSIKILDGQGSAATEISLLGNSLTMVGSVVMMLPVPGAAQIAGGITVATGAALSAVSWAMEHPAQIEKFCSDAGRGIDESVHEVEKIVTNPIGAAHDLLRDLL